MSETVIIFLATRLYFLVLLGGAIFALLIPKTKQVKLCWITFFTLPLSFILSRVVSYLYFNPRPFVSHDFDPLIFHVADNGFPSDHMLLVSVISMIVYTFNKPIGIGLIVLSVLVGLGRVLSGVHHLLDILGSFVIAVSVVYLVHLFFNRYNNKN